MSPGVLNQGVLNQGGREAVALTIAGSDSSGGAGIQADLKTFAAYGVYGASAITALTAQNTLGVQGVSVVDPAFVVRQIDSVMSDLNVIAAKTGMLATAAIVNAVAARFRSAPGVALVVDPVMIATSGDALLDANAVAKYHSELLPLATLITPNVPEAARLLNANDASTIDDAVAQAKALAIFSSGAVLLKGGHGTADEVVDVLCDGGDTMLFRHPRIDTPNTHGTGCTLSAAITAGLTLGMPLRDAVGRAIEYVSAALAAGRSRRVGAGHGPPDHQFALRRSGNGRS